MKSPEEDNEIRKRVVSDPETGEDLLNFLSLFFLMKILLFLNYFRLEMQDRGFPIRRKWTCTRKIQVIKGTVSISRKINERFCIFSRPAIIVWIVFSSIGQQYLNSRLYLRQIFKRQILLGQDRTVIWA